MKRRLLSFLGCFGLFSILAAHFSFDSNREDLGPLKGGSPTQTATTYAGSDSTGTGRGSPFR
jgi:hypothetical protein